MPQEADTKNPPLGAGSLILSALRALANPPFKQNDGNNSLRDEIFIAHDRSIYQITSLRQESDG